MGHDTTQRWECVEKCEGKGKGNLANKKELMLLTLSKCSLSCVCDVVTVSFGGD